MKYIRKHIANCPDWLVRYKRSWNPEENLGRLYPIYTRNPPKDEFYNDNEHESLPKNLANEQFNICCYCMVEINRKGSSDVTPEHFIPQRRYINTTNHPFYNESHYSIEEHEREQTNYMNLLASCSGREGCSSKKGNFPFASDPRHRDCETIVEILDDGNYYLNDKNWENDFITLKLIDNNPRYLSQRRAIIEEASERLKKKNKENQDRLQQNLQEEIEYWTTPQNGSLRPFCMAAVHYLKRKQR